MMTVLNVFYGENDTFIENWINVYLEQEMESLKLAPCDKNVKKDSINYFVEMKDGVYFLVKTFKVILKGYIYNSSEKVSEKLTNSKTHYTWNFNLSNNASVS